MIQVGINAKNKLISLMKEEGHDKNSFVRVSVTSGGCSGLSYNLGFDTEKKMTTICLRTMK